MAYLITTATSVVKQDFRLKAGLTVIGRHPECDIVIEDNAVSRRHAQIRKNKNQFYITDLNSRNGTLVNNELIHQETLLFDNSKIEICEVVFTFQEDDDISKKRPATVTERPSSSKTSHFDFDDFPEANSSIRRQFDLPSSHQTKRAKNDLTHSDFDVRKDDSIERKLGALMTVSHSLRDAHEPMTIVTQVLDSLFDLFVDADRGFVAMREESGQIIPFAMKTRREQDAERVRISRTIINQVLDSQKAILSSDAASDERFDLSKSIADFRIRSMMCAPLINSEGVAIGAIQLDTLRSSIAFNESDLEVLVTAAMQASLALQNVELYKKVEQSRRLDDDLKLAHEVQKRFLPQHHPDCKAYEFFTYYRPMAQVGGDYYDFVQLDENRMAIIVADVVGHGIAAAMLMAKISAESRFAIAINPDPVAAITLVNKNLSNLNLDKFVTLVLGLVDFEQHMITIVNAGHTLPIHLKKAGEIRELNFEGNGMPLGILDAATYGAFSMQIEPGDSIVFYTDGVNECMNNLGQQLGTENLLNELRLSQAKTPQSIGSTICQSIKRHVGTYEQIDDICVVVIGRNK